VPAVACQCQTLPASAGHSHSIVNEPFSRLNINGLVVMAGGNTMKNTMFGKSCAGIAQDHVQVAVDVKK
jgi:hypothetical protein